MRTRGSMMHCLTPMLALLLVIGWGPVGPATAVAAEGGAASFEVVDEDGIYYGEGKNPVSPAVMVADDVWAEIPEYKRIVDEDLDEEDAEYHLLLKKASERFQQALEKVAKRDGYDMVGESGSIEVRGDKEVEIPDITEDLIEIVSRG